MKTRLFTLSIHPIEAVLLLFIAICLQGSPVAAQIPGLEATQWYFGTGTDGLKFPGPVRVSTKAAKMGFEGMVVVNDPANGNLRFYSDGATVLDANNSIITGGTGLNGSFSGTQCVQACKWNCDLEKFYLLTNTAEDFTTGNLFYSIVDFTGNPNGVVTNVNTPITSTGIYDQGNALVNRPGTNQFWWIAHAASTPTYHVFSISGATIAGPTTYTFAQAGYVATMAYSNAGQKLAVAGSEVGLTLLDFDPETGVLSNEIVVHTTTSYLGDFSPSGLKLYFVKNNGLYQYDLGNAVTTNLATCCSPHDTQRAPNGKMYHINTYNSKTPLSVINFPDLPGRACAYATLPLAFDGEVRRFPEFVTHCDKQLPPGCCTNNILKNPDFSSGHHAYGTGGGFTRCGAIPGNSYATDWCGLNTPQYSDLSSPYGIGIAMWGLGANTSNGEAFYQAVSIAPDSAYTICFDGIFKDQVPDSPNDVTVRFRAFTHPPTAINDPGGVLIGEVTLTNTNWANHVLASWTPPTYFKYLLVSAHNSSTSPSGGTASWAFVDNFCMRRDTLVGLKQ